MELLSGAGKLWASEQDSKSRPVIGSFPVWRFWQFYPLCAVSLLVICGFMNESLFVLRVLGIRFIGILPSPWPCLGCIPGKWHESPSYRKSLLLPARIIRINTSISLTSFSSFPKKVFKWKEKGKKQATSVLVRQFAAVCRWHPPSWATELGFLFAFGGRWCSWCCY